jgi:hypothetical protein
MFFSMKMFTAEVTVQIQLAVPGTRILIANMEDSRIQEVDGGPGGTHRKTMVGLLLARLISSPFPRRVLGVVHFDVGSR